ncbi:MAG: hypothetical protein KDI44_02595 [Thiothrix sp.]|nr:hypothetical protein [Thiothrix sp.]HPQ94184.1 hypothetical protein [Thiolinea sp.]
MSDLDDDLNAMYAQLQSADEEAPETEDAPDKAQPAPSPPPHAGKAEANNTDTKPPEPELPHAGKAEGNAGPEDGTQEQDAGHGSDNTNPTWSDYSQLRRSARKLEKAKRGLEKQLDDERGNAGRLQAELDYIRSRHGDDTATFPTGINMQGVRDGDPDAIADALAFIQHQAQQGRYGPADREASVDGNTRPPDAGASPPAPLPSSWNDFVDTLPDNSPVHELDAWVHSGNPALMAAAKAAEQAILSDPESQGKTPESLYIEVVRRVKAGLDQRVEQQFQQAEQRQQPRSLSQAGGNAGRGGLSLMEQFAQADDPEAFMAKLPESQQKQLWASLGL